ncbi:MAG: DUF504 domain-containing protein [Candidatus Lokiarchaeota archaeon]|nr:DUF504 domain-containing protein [Candidatus Lokiarchaeota archaeon]
MIKNKDTIRAILNELKWNKKYDERDFTLKYIHRGSPRGYKKINISEIKDILGAFFTLNEKEFNDQLINIPFHRILEIKNEKINKIIYEKVQ